MIPKSEDQLSDRIKTLKQKENYSKKMYSQRREIFEHVFSENQSEPIVIRMAKGLAAFLREKDIFLYEDDFLAGYVQRYDPFKFVDKKYASFWPAIKAGSGNVEETFLLKNLKKGLGAGLFGSVPGAHMSPGYNCVLSEGFGVLANRARTMLTRKKQNFAKASLIVCEAASDYVLRYATEAEKLFDKITNEQCQEYLKRIADACRWVAFNPPRNFIEAVQLFLLTHEIIMCEQAQSAVSLGRLDQYFFPYYAKDLAAGVITYREASELVEALWIKLNGFKEGFQNVVVGGSQPDGGYAVNDISYMCLQASRKLKMVQPLITVRWHPSIPEEFWNEIQKLIEVGIGFPALFNDEIAIAAKRRLGISNEDAQNYGIMGCVEVSISGKEFSHTEILRINWAKILELMLTGGICAVTGNVIDFKNKRRLETIESFEEFYQWYKEELAYVIDRAIKGINILDRDFSKQRPYPFLSSTMEGCLEAGLDVTAGGTIYNLTSVNGCGMADTADSLAAIKQIVYEKKEVSLAKLAEILHNNFEDAEVFRKTLITTCPKYGNDNNEPDYIMKDLADYFCHEVERHSNPRGGRFQTGLYTVMWHASLGKYTGALPNGRRAGVALANGLSPSQGVDVLGPTAVINSITKLNHRLFGNGMVLDLKFHPSFFVDSEHRKIFRDLIETYFQLGGMEIQFNVIKRETLLAAQKSPEEYRDLLVRVSGYSDYFINLDKVCQDEIITRTDQGKFEH